MFQLDMTQWAKMVQKAAKVVGDIQEFKAVKKTVLPCISALVKEMSSFICLSTLKCDFSPTHFGQNRVKNMKKCDFLASFENHTFFTFFT